MSVVQNIMVSMPEGSFCMLVILTALILDRLGYTLNWFNHTVIVNP